MHNAKVAFAMEASESTLGRVFFHGLGETSQTNSNVLKRSQKIASSVPGFHYSLLSDSYSCKCLRDVGQVLPV